MKKYNVAVVGATGMVGNKFLEVLSERNLPVENYYLYASAKSAGKVIDFMGKPHTVIGRRCRKPRICARICRKRRRGRR